MTHLAASRMSYAATRASNALERTSGEVEQGVVESDQMPLDEKTVLRTEQSGHAIESLSHRLAAGLGGQLC
jgi:hypothetical protein